MHLNSVVNVKCVTWGFFFKQLCIDKSSVGRWGYG